MFFNLLRKRGYIIKIIDTLTHSEVSEVPGVMMENRLNQNICNSSILFSYRIFVNQTIRDQLENVYNTKTIKNNCTCNKIILRH